jgi:alpha-L-rhamnosidase
MGAATNLRAEHLGDAVLGLGERRPRLSWRLPEGASRQDAYRIEVDGAETGRIESTDSVLVPWPDGEELGSRSRVSWRVKVWTDGQESEWSEPAWFETGLLDPSDWSASWIEPVEVERAPHVLRTRFPLDAVPAAARMYATAHGIYETFLNGRRVGDLELAPGCTDYHATLHVQVYDLADLLQVGENSWEVVLSDGWWRGRTGFMQIPNGFGDTTAFLGQLEADGEVVAVSGASWESSTGAIISADLMAGQVEDRRRTAEDWQPVSVADHDFARLGHSTAPPSRRVQEIRPVSVTALGEGRHVVDLGHNINGWVRLTNLGPAGAATTLVHGEAIDAAGEVTQTNLVPEMLVEMGVVPGMTDTVTSAGHDGDVFEPRHTTHGFQFVGVDGHRGELTPDDITGVVVHTDLTTTGSFHCSDDRLNRLHEICDWSFRGNACEIPTDCPQRERSGWTGDWQVFVPTAAFLYDVAGFSIKWLRDVVAEQLPNGCITNISPDALRWRDPVSDQWAYMQGSSGWGDAIVMVPWELWRAYGDRGALEEFWPAMVAWVDFAANSARTSRNAKRVEARPEPAAHEAYLWDGGFHWGEWLEPGSQGFDRDADQGAVGTAFLHHSALLAARIGAMLGYEKEVARFGDLAQMSLAAWRTEFIGADGSVTPDTQATHVRALAFDLVPDGLRAQTATRLVELIREAGTHLGTGFLATPYLLPVLADSGHLDVAYELLFQDTAPSWLAMVDRGATTIWESWEGIDDEGVARESLNHYSKGAVISFLHRYVAGIELLDDDPAYRRFRVAPRPGGGITSAEATHDSPYGRIAVSWHLAGDTFVLDVTVPAGTTAEVALPDGSSVDQGPGTMMHRCAITPQRHG